MPASSSPPAPDGSPLSGADRRALTRFLEQGLDHGFRLAIVEVIGHAEREDILADLEPTIGPGLLRVALDELPGADTNLWMALQQPFATSAPRCLALWGLDSGARTDWAAQLNLQRDLFVRDFAVPWLLFIHPASRVPLMQVAPDFCDFATLWLRDDRQSSPPVTFTKIHSPDSALTLSHLKIDEPLLRQAWSALEAARFDEARDALARFDLQPEHSALDHVRRQLCGARLELVQGHEALAEAHVRDARNLLGRLPATAETEALTRQADLQVALVHMRSGRYTEAETVLRRALQHVEEAAGGGHLTRSVFRYSLAHILVERGKYAEAEAILRDVISFLEKTPGREHPAYGVSLRTLGQVLAIQGKHHEAEAILHTAIPVLERTLGREHPDYGRSLASLAGILAQRGNSDEAEPLYRASISTLERTLGREHPDLITALQGLAITLVNQGKRAEAEELLREVVAIGEELLGREHPGHASSLTSLAVALAAQGKYHEAEQALRGSLAILEKSLGPGHPRLCLTLTTLAAVAARQGRVREGIRLLERALELGRTSMGPDSLEVAGMRDALRQLQRRRRRR